MPALCNGGRVNSIVVSSEGAGYGFLVDDQGRLHQAGFGPDIDAHMERLPAGVPPALYPLAYPAYDEEPTRAPSLRVTHSDGTTTTQPEGAGRPRGRPSDRHPSRRPRLPDRRSRCASTPTTTACCASG